MARDDSYAFTYGGVHEAPDASGLFTIYGPQRRVYVGVSIETTDKLTDPQKDNAADLLAHVNRGDLFGEHRAVKPALGFGLDSTDEPPELLRKRDKFLFNENARRLRALCGLTYGDGHSIHSTSK